MKLTPIASCVTLAAVNPFSSRLKGLCCVLSAVNRVAGLLLFLFCMFSDSLQAAQPIIPLSAKLADTSGRVIDGPMNITFRLYTEATGGTPIWAEAHVSIPVTRGVFSVNLGETSDLGSVEGEEFWVGVTVNTDSEMSPRLKLPGYAASSIGGASGGVPVGTVVAFAGTVPPKGWLVCDGSMIDKIQFRRLAIVLGATFGAGDEDRVKLPDLRGRAIIGAGMGGVRDQMGRTLTDRTLGVYGGEEVHQLTIAELPSHKHDTFAEDDPRAGKFLYWGGSGAWKAIGGGGSSGDYWVPRTGAAGGDQAHNVTSPFLVCNWIIRAK